MTVVEFAADHIVLAVRAWTASTDHEDVHQAIAAGLLGVIETRMAPAIGARQPKTATQDDP
jgi:hypothetical protein